MITVFCGARRTDNNKLRLSILDMESLSLYMERLSVDGKVNPQTVENLLNILAVRNRQSVNLEIGVLVPGNHLFVLNYIFYSYENICQSLVASAVRSSLYKYPYRNYDSVCTKVNLKSDFYIAGQLIETHPEYSLDGKSAGLLLGKANRPFLKMDLMIFCLAFMRQSS